MPNRSTLGLRPFLLCATFLGLLAASCALSPADLNNGMGAQVVPVRVSQLTVTPTSATIGLTAGTSLQLKPWVEPAYASNQTILWTSSDDEIATVDERGVVTSTGTVSGNIVITATSVDGLHSASCAIEVKDVPATAVAFRSASLTLVAKRIDGYVPLDFQPANATNRNGTWSSDNPLVASVDNGSIRPLQPGSTVIRFLSDDGAPETTLSVMVQNPQMTVGSNLWNANWQAWQEHYIYFKSGITDWATETNPWNQSFLDDLAGYNGPIRMMDWDNANWSPIVHWADRIPKGWNHYLSTTNEPFVGQEPGEIISNDTSEGGYPIPIDSGLRRFFPDQGFAAGWTRQMGIAYEWQIDLCNRTDKDLWLNVPVAADDDYMEQLALLVQTLLKPSLHCYVEYGNENWNDGWRQDYVGVKGVALGLPGIDGLPSNQWYQGESFSAYRSLQMFKIFVDRFGAGNTGLGKRLIRVLSSGGDLNLGWSAVKNVVFDGIDRSDYSSDDFNPRWNPHGMIPDLYCVAPYVGAGIENGAAADIVTKWRIEQASQTLIQASFRDAWRGFHIPIGAYEGGQHLYSSGTDVWSRNPLIYDEYRSMLDSWKELGFAVFVHYTLYSTYEADTAWGAKNLPTDLNTKAASPKYAALVDWINANP